MQPEILFLAHRIPYPPDKGDKIRSWRLLEHFRQNYRIHLGCFIDDPEDEKHCAFLAEKAETSAFVRLDKAAARLKSALALAGGGPLSFAYYDHSEMRRYVDQARKRTFAFEFAFSSTMTPYISHPVEGRPRLVDLCDADSEKWGQYADKAGAPMRWIYRSEHQRLASAETSIVNWADRTFAISKAEADVVESRPGVARAVEWFGNGVDADFFSPSVATPDPKRSADVVFVGAMDYEANIEAALWFLENAWPDIRRTAPEARFAIIGPRPDTRVNKFDGANGVSILGRVDDVRPLLQQARAVIAPLRVARGVQNKVLEAMAMARPVVATSGANAGIGARDNTEILIADTPQAFAGCVINLLGDCEKGDVIGAAARKKMISDFSWSRQLARLDEAISAFTAR